MIQSERLSPRRFLRLVVLHRIEGRGEEMEREEGEEKGAEKTRQ